MSGTSEALQVTPLSALHHGMGAKMVPFAGYEMPLQFSHGIIHEHRHTRASASLFDVSHMGQVCLSGDGAGAALETLVPADVIGLADGTQCYSVFTNDHGGIEDDLIIARQGGSYLLVFNAMRRQADLARLTTLSNKDCYVTPLDRALLAIQGPFAAEVMSRHAHVAELYFLRMATIEIMGAVCWVSRSGYTGEDGFEISLPASDALRIAEALLEDPSLAPAGLGARDVLRLEAGLCLYGHDIDSNTTVAEAALNWTIAPARRPNGIRGGGFPGTETVFTELENGPKRVRCGLTIEGRAVAREGTEVYDEYNQAVGQITSGTFSPELELPIAMAYIERSCATVGTRLTVGVRNKQIPATVTKLPFVQTRYVRREQ